MQNSKFLHARVPSALCVNAHLAWEIHTSVSSWLNGPAFQRRPGYARTEKKVCTHHSGRVLDWMRCRAECDQRRSPTGRWTGRRSFGRRRCLFRWRCLSRSCRTASHDQFARPGSRRQRSPGTDKAIRGPQLRAWKAFQKRDFLSGQLRRPRPSLTLGRTRRIATNPIPTLPNAEPPYARESPS